MVRAELSEAPLEAALAFARRAGRMQRDGLRCWIGDCAWRVLHPTREAPDPPLRYELASFAVRGGSERRAQFLAEVRRYLFAGLECEDLTSFAANARMLVCERGEDTARAAAPSRTHEDVTAMTREIWARFVENERWQAERLLLRLALLPTLDEVSVTLDHIEAAGRLPTQPSLRDCVDSLRAHGLAQRKLPIELILAYLEHLSPLERMPSAPEQEP